MALLVMAVHDTETNERSSLTSLTLLGLSESVDWNKGHRLIVVDNGSCQKTKDMLAKLDWLTVITMPENVGTARAVNEGLKLRELGEYCVKLDNDVLIHCDNWVEQMQDAMERMPQIGILGLKRRDLLESPHSINTDQRSRLLEVPHTAGQRWYVVEECKHIMGTCTMLSPKLLDRIGYFGQPGLYGFDDSLMCIRSSVAGFYNCFLHGIDIDHIDPGGTLYTTWKAKHAGDMLMKYATEEEAYKKGLKDVYYDGGFKS